jgi:hypothetical protein
VSAVKQFFQRVLGTAGAVLRQITDLHVSVQNALSQCSKVDPTQAMFAISQHRQQSFAIAAGAQHIRPNVSHILQALLIGGADLQKCRS